MGQGRKDIALIEKLNQAGLTCIITAHDREATASMGCIVLQYSFFRIGLRCSKLWLAVQKKL